MFNLDDAIADWRRRMGGGIKSAESLDELESHLRDDVEQQARGGRDLEEAFTAASARIGQPDALRIEFGKRRKFSKAALELLTMTIWEPPHFSPDQMKRAALQMKHAALALAGVPQQYAAPELPGANIEPRWATYFRTAVLFVPALLLWVAATVVVAPKLREVSLSAGMRAEEMPQIALTLLDAMAYLSAHWMTFGGVVVIPLVLLEWRSRRWPRYRRAILGAGAVLLNLTVLLSISLIGLLAVVVAVKLTATVK